MTKERIKPFKRLTPKDRITFLEMIITLYGKDFPKIVERVIRYKIIQEIVEEIIKIIKNPDESSYGLQTYITGTTKDLQVFIRDKDLISMLTKIQTLTK